MALLTASRDQGHLVLAELIDLVRSNPTLTTGTLLERYRDHRLAPHFAALLTDVIDLGPEGAQTEFSAALELIRNQLSKQPLPEPEKPVSGRSQEDKEELRRRFRDMGKKR